MLGLLARAAGSRRSAKCPTTITSTARRPSPPAAPLPQAESSDKLKSLEQELAAARQRHDKAMKEAQARHKKEMEDATERTAKVGGRGCSAAVLGVVSAAGGDCVSGAGPVPCSARLWQQCVPSYVLSVASQFPLPLLQLHLCSTSTRRRLRSASCMRRRRSRRRRLRRWLHRRGGFPVHTGL